MKTTIFTLSLICVSVWSHAQQLIHKTVTSCENRPVNCVEIPSNFSQDQLKHTEQILALQNKQIKRIELCYTRYKQSSNFNQTELNNQRIAKLKEILAIPSDQSIQWVGIEQTGAKTKEAAAHYFHGFRIYTKEAVTVQERFHIDDTGNPNQIFQVNNDSTNTIQLTNGQLHIPRNAVMDQSGNIVRGSYQLSFKDYRDLAEIAFSGIPMIYSDSSTNWGFRSAGMFEIQATQNNNPLMLAKELEFNYNATEQLPNTNFYELDTITGLWNKTRNQLFTQPEIRLESPSIKQTNIEFPKGDFARSQLIEINTHFMDSMAFAALTPALWVYYEQFEKEHADFLQKALINKNVAEKRLVIKTQLHDEFVEKLLGFRQNEYNQQFKRQQELNAKQMKYLEENLAGHYYPNLVQNLRIPQFGVFNCDQQFRLGDVFVIAPTFIDAKTGDTIQDLKVACVIDKVAQGSFSFSPNKISVNKAHESTILLFGENDALYCMNYTNLINIGDEKTPVVRVESIANKVKNSDDLRQFLKL